MRTKKLSLLALVAVAAALALLALTAIQIKAIDDRLGGIVTKFRHKLNKEGVSGVWDSIVERFDSAALDTNASIRYSLYDRSSYPPVEDAAARAALSEYRVIAGLDIDKYPAARPIRSRYDTWHRSHGDDSSSKYSSLNQIAPDNVRQLEVAWTYGIGSELGDAARNGTTVETNPVVAHGKLFVSSIDGLLISIDAATGLEVWRLRLPGPVARRGMVWEPNEDFARSRLFVPAGDGVYAVNAATGQVLKDFGNNGQVGDQLSLIAPAIVNDKLIVAIVKPAVEAYDLRTGKLLWSRALLDKADARNTNLYGGVPWGGMSADASRSTVYVSTGNPRPELIGTTRPGANRHSCSVVSIDANTGRIVWAFQEISHDLWDLDIPSPPVLTTITKDDKRIDVVATVTKSGNTVLLDRDLGRPIFDYRLKRAPVSTIPGEKTAPYQPAVEVPEPFGKQVFDMSDVTDLSRSARQTVLRKMGAAKSGFFEPPVLGGKVVLFGLHGGAEWPGAAVDPRGVLYVPSNQIPWIIRTGYVDANATAESAAAIPGDSLYQRKCATCHKPNRAGSYEAEYTGDAYFPTLTGITLLRDREALTSPAQFAEEHGAANLDQMPTSSELEKLFEYFAVLDKASDQRRSLSLRAFWQVLLDDQGYPGSKPPWGLLTAIDLNTGKRRWQVPFGEYQHLQRGGSPVKGQINFGGVVATGGGLVFATGTIDNRIRAFDANDGRELWSFKLPAAGSAPPLTYEIDGTQYVAVVATGGSFHGFSGRSDKVIAFRLPAALR